MALEASKKELNRAKQDRKKLNDATDLAEYENYWRDILGYLVKCHNKLLSEGETINKEFFNKVISHHKNSYKVDPLLKYLKEARNTDQHHHIVEMVEKQAASFTFKSTGSTTINALYFDEKGNPGFIGSGDPLQFEFQPELVIAKSVFDKNGNVIPPPLYHLGNPLKQPKSVDELISLGIKYFEDLIISIESRLKKEGLIL
jgi:hypothetical protein